nr:MAG TPA: hypothetical protein [Caudoviricetes sp.]
MTKEEYIERIKRKEKYNYIEYEDLDEVYEIAKMELLLTLYASKTDMITEETEIPYAYTYKVLEAMEEIIDIGDMRNFTSYQENGWSWTRPEGGLIAYRNINSMGL